MTTLALEDEHAKMGKISNNLEWAGEEQHVTGFTLPFELQVPRPQLVGLMGEDFDRAVWKLDGAGTLTGTDWARRILPISLTDETYIGVAAALVLGGRELEYADCRWSKIELLAFGNGGITHVKGHLYLRPGIGSENLLLQEYQESEVAVSISSGKLRVKADKRQQQLPLEPPAAAAPKTERDLAFERGETVDIITTVVDEIVTHEHPSFVGGKASHTQGAGCMVCSGDVQTITRVAAVDIGTPEEERAKAHERERQIARDLETAHLKGDGPGDDDEDQDDDDDSMSGLGRRISEHAAKTA